MPLPDVLKYKDFAGNPVYVLRAVIMALTPFYDSTHGTVAGTYLHLVSGAKIAVDQSIDACHADIYP